MATSYNYNGKKFFNFRTDFTIKKAKGDERDITLSSTIHCVEFDPSTNTRKVKEEEKLSCRLFWQHDHLDNKYESNGLIYLVIGEINLRLNKERFMEVVSFFECLSKSLDFHDTAELWKNYADGSTNPDGFGNSLLLGMQVDVADDSRVGIHLKGEIMGAMALLDRDFVPYIHCWLVTEVGPVAFSD